MQGLIIDASVAVKWLSHDKEAFIDQAFEILAGAYKRHYTLIAPDLLGIEVANALVRGKGLKGQLLQQALTLFFDLPIEFEPSTFERIARASMISAKFSLTVYDSLYVGLALEKNMSLITANSKHQGRVRRANVFDLKNWGREK